MKIYFFLIISLVFPLNYTYSQSMVSLTFDDPATTESPLLNWQERNSLILETLNKNKLKAALFVCGHRVDDENGQSLIESWDNQNHQIANHSFNHYYYHSKKITYEDFKNDFIKNDFLISQYVNFTKLFRFPYLKEGDTSEKRDSARALLKQLNYNVGYVSIDASDWFVNKLLTDTLTLNPNADIEIYRQLYIMHIMERANFYDSLASLLTGRKVKHTLLLHHNLTSALFLNDLIKAFKDNDWEVISSSEAWTDPVYQTSPDILPAGESIIWALAKETGNYESILRYPGEDSQYEEKVFREYLNRNR